VAVAAFTTNSLRTRKKPEAANVDMQIDSNRIRTEREQRAWSQEHLAEVAGLSLRTIQRVETTGSTSFETARALAAVLELDLSALRAPEAVPQEGAPKRRSIVRGLRYLGVAASLVIALGAFFVRDAVAGDISLDVTLELNAEKLGEHNLVANEGKSAEIRHEGKLRLFVNPIVTSDGSILLSMRVEEPSGSKWVEVGEPRIMVVNGTQGQVKVTSPRGNVYRIAITPRRR
jgi:transcriptional regulator with XRE-family HTH domain